jgi:hypothetical protein
MRRCFAPILYWKTNDLEPRPRSRSPKPGKSASKNMASLLPAGTLNVRTVVAVSFIERASC